jgi:WD40 repeat protein
VEGHSRGVSSVEFHPTAQLLATGSNDKTVMLWRLSSDNSSATRKANMYHGDDVTSVAFHPTAPLLAFSSGSGSGSVRMWLPFSYGVSATLEVHNHGVTSVAFHPTAQLLRRSSINLSIIIRRF